jgi:hypothetical protein
VGHAGLFAHELHRDARRVDDARRPLRVVIVDFYDVPRRGAVGDGELDPHRFGQAEIIAADGPRVAHRLARHFAVFRRRREELAFGLGRAAVQNQVVHLLRVFDDAKANTKVGPEAILRGAQANPFHLVLHVECVFSVGRVLGRDGVARECEVDDRRFGEVGSGHRVIGRARLDLARDVLRSGDARMRDARVELRRRAFGPCAGRVAELEAVRKSVAVRVLFAEGFGPGVARGL